MRLLIDTHALIWLMAASPRLSAHAEEVIKRRDHEAFVSVASLWEMAIKRSLGKLQMPPEWVDDIIQALRANSVQLLGVSAAHCGRVAELPFHHRDPFDRLLVAQAEVEGLAIVSADEAFDAYLPQRIW